MRPVQGFDQVQGSTGTFERIEAGGYVCSIISARVEQSSKGNDMLVIAFDIDEGKFRGFYKKDFENRKSKANGYTEVKWRGIYRQRVLDNDGMCNPYFKGLTEAIEGSNPGYKWNWDELSLKGKRVGFVFRDEEYQRNDGSIGVSAKPTWPRTVDEIRKGVVVPEIKRFNGASGGGYGASGGGYGGGYGNGSYDNAGTAGRSYGGSYGAPPDDDELPF